MWVLEADALGTPGTAVKCTEVMAQLGSTTGWCVGDAETLPVPGVFDASPFAIGRGFDIIVERSTMEIAYSTSHGTPGGNENITGDDLLQAVRDVIAALP